MAKKETPATPAPETPETPAQEPKESRNTAKVDADLKKNIADMKAHLASQAKVRVLVPLESGEKLGEQLPVEINGYRMNVPKGVYVDVPQSVADIISQAYNVYEQNAAAALKADRDASTAAALNR